MDSVVLLSAAPSLTPSPSPYGYHCLLRTPLCPDICFCITKLPGTGCCAGWKAAQQGQIRACMGRGARAQAWSGADKVDATLSQQA